MKKGNLLEKSSVTIRIITTLTDGSQSQPLSPFFTCVYMGRRPDVVKFARSLHDVITWAQTLDDFVSLFVFFSEFVTCDGTHSQVLCSGRKIFCSHQYNHVHMLKKITGCCGLCFIVLVGKVQHIHLKSVFCFLALQTFTQNVYLSKKGMNSL